MKKIVFLVVFLMGCASHVERYNMDDAQDTDCFRHYGAMQGYCDQSHYGASK